MKRLLAALAAILCAGALAYAAPLTITGTNSEFKNSIFWVGVPRISRDESITATPSGTISTAYQLSAGISYVTTVATAGDAVKFPPTTGAQYGGQSGGGLQMVIINATANSMNIFPFQASDTINALSGGAAYALANGKTVTCFVGIDGKWYCNLSA